MPIEISLVSPLIYRVIQTPAIIAILWEGRTTPNFVQIFTDGRRRNSFPTWMGESIGRWEGDTLVVDTIGFNDRSWIGMYPHTEMLHVVRRYRRPDAGHIEKEVTIEDPGTFTKPWKIRQTWDMVPGEEVHEYNLQRERKGRLTLEGQVMRVLGSNHTAMKRRRSTSPGDQSNLITRSKGAISAVRMARPKKMA